MGDQRVRPPVVPLTELDARELLARPLLALTQRLGPQRVAKAAGCNEKTIRNARDEKSTLRLDYVANLLLLDPAALDAVLGHYGRRSVPTDSTCDTDTDRGRQSSVLKAALALSLALEDDDEVTALEVRANRATIEAARNALDALLTKLVRAA